MKWCIGKKKQPKKEKQSNIVICEHCKTVQPISQMRKVWKIRITDPNDYSMGGDYSAPPIGNGNPRIFWIEMCLKCCKEKVWPEIKLLKDSWDAINTMIGIYQDKEIK